MFKAFRRISMSLLLLAALGSALANPGERQEWRGARHAERQQRVTERQDLQYRREIPMQRQGDRQRAGDPRYAPVAPPRQLGAAADPRGDNRFNTAPDGFRRPGRMTLEERRALRRQINEAGHDIYTPYRR